MSTFDTYQTRISAKGVSLREVRKKREFAFINHKLPDSLSYHTVLIGGEHGEEQQVAIINRDNLEEKTVVSLPEEDIPNGALIYWMDNHWLVLARDYNTEIYTKCTMVQCNYFLRWINKAGKIVERWCIISDGTKYLTGETISSYNKNNMSLGDTRIQMIIARDEESRQLSRKNRFLIDDYDSETVLAYRLTKPFKLGGVYNGEGAMSFVLSEVDTEDSDNFELHIANYYERFPREGEINIPLPPDPGTPDANGKVVWF